MYIQNITGTKSSKRRLEKYGMKLRNFWKKIPTKEVLEISKVVFPHSRPRNLKDFLQRANLHKTKAHKESILLGVSSS